MDTDTLNLLINLSNLNGVQLSSILSVAPSYISLLRSGRRRLKADNPLLDRLTEIFTPCLDNSQNIDILQKAFDLDPVTFTKLDSEEARQDFIRSLYQRIPLHIELGSNKTTMDPTRISDQIHLNIQEAMSGGKIYHGRQGKLEALRTLIKACSLSKDFTDFYVISEGDLNWLTHSVHYVKKVQAMIAMSTERKLTVHAIHRLDRSIGDLLRIFEICLLFSPIVKAFDSHTINRIRDNVLNLTIILAPGIGGILSVDSFHQDHSLLTFYITDQAGLESLKASYDQYLKITDPIFEDINITQLTDILPLLTMNGLRNASPCLYFSHLPSIQTMPDEVIEHICDAGELKQFKEQITKMRRSFHDNLSLSTNTDVLSLPDINNLRPESLRLPYSDLCGQRDFYYNPTLLRLHLEESIRLLDTVPNYHIQINSIYHETFFFSKERCCMIIHDPASQYGYLLVRNSQAIRTYHDLHNYFFTKVLETDRRKVKKYLQNYVAKLTALEKDPACILYAFTPK